jgi:Fusaric acid resistance protein-like
MDHPLPAPAADTARGTLRDRLARRLRALTGRSSWRDRPLSELLGIDRNVLWQALKIAVSAGVSWALAGWLLDSPSPIWAPITASLIALLTVRASIRDAVEKVVAVLIGIVVAIWLGDLIGLHAWSISLIVALGFLVGKVLRLNGGAAAQIPINGLFVLALGSAQSGQRFLDTLIGAAVAVTVNFLIVPPNYVSAATRSVVELSDGVVDVLSAIADGISQPWRIEQATAWLRGAREQGRISTAAESDVDRAAQSLELHPGRASWAGALGRLQQANDTLQIVEVQVRTLARTIRDIATKMSAQDGLQPPMPMVSATLSATARAIEAFGHTLLRAEKDARVVVTGGTAHRAVEVARAKIAEINADLADMLAANLARGVFLGTLVVETGRILDELDSGLAAVRPASEEPVDLINPAATERTDQH